MSAVEIDELISTGICMLPFVAVLGWAAWALIADRKAVD